MTARIIDGKVIAAELRARVAGEVARIKTESGLTPGLAVVLVGSDPASQVYVRSKHKQTQEAGMASFEHRLPADVAQADLLALITRLNRDPLVHGILVQLPLPKSLHTETIINAIDPAKDVEWRQYPGNLLALAVEKGEVQALAEIDPLPYLWLKEGKLTEIATNLSGEYADRTCCILAIRGSLTREELPVAAALTRSVMEGGDRVASDPADAATVYSGYGSKASIEDLTAMFQSHNHHDHPVGATLGGAGGGAPQGGAASYPEGQHRKRNRHRLRLPCSTANRRAAHCRRSVLQ